MPSSPDESEATAGYCFPAPKVQTKAMRLPSVYSARLPNVPATRRGPSAGGCRAVASRHTGSVMPRLFAGHGRPNPSRVAGCSIQRATRRSGHQRSTCGTDLGAGGSTATKVEQRIRAAWTHFERLRPESAPAPSGAGFTPAHTSPWTKPPASTGSICRRSRGTGAPDRSGPCLTGVPPRARPGARRCWCRPARSGARWSCRGCRRGRRR